MSDEEREKELDEYLAGIDRKIEKTEVLVAECSSLTVQAQEMFVRVGATDGVTVAAAIATGSESIKEVSKKYRAKLQDELLEHEKTIALEYQESRKKPPKSPRKKRRKASMGMRRI